MSARAAWRLVSLAFPQVFRYTAGKADWSAYGLPTEGKSVTPNRAGNLARRDVATCSLSDSADTVRQQLRKNGGTLCAVLNEHRVLLGQISAQKVESETDSMAEGIMTSAPTTLRPPTAVAAAYPSAAAWPSCAAPTPPPARPAAA